MQGSFRGKSRPSELRAYPATSETTAEDFLFHLYRGSELLQDDRVHQAKEELEAALRLQPRDPKGQDLLAVVYFRLGLYPRAIEIYEELVRAFPQDASLGNNLALCYLKTGQSEKARTVLEQLVMHQPEHVRAWAYLGLAYERLGDYGKAKEAFERGQATGMARRMAERLHENSRHTAGFDLGDDEGGIPPSEGFEELEDREVALSIAPPPPSLPPPAGLLRATVPPPLPSLRPEGPREAARPAEFFRTLAQPIPEGAQMVASSPAMVRARFTECFAARLEAVRALVAHADELGSEPLLRRSGSHAGDQALGGPIAPLMALYGTGELVLGARQGHRLLPLILEDESLFVRESILVGFDGRLAYESLDLTDGEGASVQIVELHGKGGVVLEVGEALSTVDIDESQAALVRRDALLGWMGQLGIRALSASEAPGRALGLLSISGAGKVLLAPRSGGLHP